MKAQRPVEREALGIGKPRVDSIMLVTSEKLCNFTKDKLLFKTGMAIATPPWITMIE